MLFIANAKYIEFTISLLEDAVVVVVVITPPLPRDGGTTRTAIQVHASTQLILG